MTKSPPDISYPNLTKEDQVIVVIGMGYVGLTFAVFAASLGVQVCGIEKNLELADKISEGKTDVRDVGLQEELKKVIDNGLLVINNEVCDLDNQKIYVVTVGTPLEYQSSSIDQMSEVAEFIGSSIRERDLVVLRSTVEIGTTKNLFESLSAISDKEFYFSMCPERTVEGRALQELRSLPQVVSGVNPKSLEMAKNFFEGLGVETISAESTDSAEFIKLISNSYRDLNFAFANEISHIGASFSINSRDAIRIANYGYPRNHIQLPGLTGGPCLEKDPLILAKSAKSNGVQTSLLSEGRKINETVPEMAVLEISRNPKLKEIPSPKFLILGIAFKGRPETSDTRGSLAYTLANEINRFFPTSSTVGYDPLISEDTEITMSNDLKNALSSSDVVFVQHNSERILNEFKAVSKDAIQDEGIVYDFWDVIDRDDLPKQATLYKFGA